MAVTDLFSSDFKEAPYWWDEANPAQATEVASHVPTQVDALVVGGGLTGVSAAYELAGAGRRVLVCDASEPGSGASTRNFGMVGRYSRHPFSALMKTKGLEAAKAYYGALDRVYNLAITRIESEGFDCDLRRTGRFIGALSPAHNARLAEEYELRSKHLNENVRIVSADEQVEIGTDVYHGGVYIADNASIHPGKYYTEMRRRAEHQGAHFLSNCAVDGISPSGPGFSVMAGGATVSARDVVIATNGYSGNLLPWVEKRLTPIIAYMVATEPLPEDIIREILPNRRSYTDNRRTTNSMTVSPDGRRLLMNGRTGERAPSIKRRAGEIYEDLVYFFPKLAGVKISHAWVCRCAATWNQFPAVGTYNGIHYALGYCFSGNAMAPHLGYKAAMRILGRPESETVWRADPLPPAAPYLARQPWAMNLLMKYFRWADRPKPLDMNGSRPPKSPAP